MQVGGREVDRPVVIQRHQLLPMLQLLQLLSCCCSSRFCLPAASILGRKNVPGLHLGHQTGSWRPRTRSSRNLVFHIFRVVLLVIELRISVSI